MLPKVSPKNPPRVPVRFPIGLVSVPPYSLLLGFVSYR